MKIMICGHAQHGKDTFAELLGIPYKSSSVCALDAFLWEVWGKQNYKTKNDCYADRHSHRAFWKANIKGYNTPDLTKLAKYIYSENDVYVGIRDLEEFYQCEKENLFDLSIWVDRSKHKPPEPESSNQIRDFMCDVTIDNNGSIIELERKAKRLRGLIDFSR